MPWGTVFPQIVVFWSKEASTHSCIFRVGAKLEPGLGLEKKRGIK